MRHFIVLIITILVCPIGTSAQPLGQMIKVLPLFAASSNVKAVYGILTIGVFSDVQSEVGEATLQKFKDLSHWGNEEVRKMFEFQTIEVVSLNGKNLADFEGQIIWVLDADVSLERLKEKTINGIFTIGAQKKKFEDCLFITVHYKDKSSHPRIERWRLVRIFANCELSNLRPSTRLKAKEGYVPKNCD